MVRKSPEELDINLDVAKRLLDDLMGFATWRTTPQGFDYWDHVHQNVEAIVEAAEGKSAAEGETK